MQKRVRRQQTSFRLDRFLDLVIQDLSHHLGDVNYGEIFRTNGSSAVLGVLESDISEAVTHGNVSKAAALRQVEAILKKNCNLPGTSNEDRRASAMRKFVDAEEHCKRTNSRWANGLPEDTSDFVKSVFLNARLWIFQTLGCVPRADEVFSLSDFGPGQTFGSMDLEHKHLYHKLSGPHTITESCRQLIGSPAFVRTYPLWVSVLISEGTSYDTVRGNRVTCVPKDAFTDRTIAIEPSLNIFVQKGIDTILRRKLKSKGIDLRSQGRNRFLARLGSISGKLATIDLSSASDTIAREVVRYFIPSDWYELLDLTRSKYYLTKDDNTWTEYAKFSSMGNAFTFPLETLLFYAVARACLIESGLTAKHLSVYGDDIVIDNEVALLAIECLESAGFVVNTSKSFLHGNFRESCGADFLQGVDIRPVYVRKNPKHPVEFFNLYNRLLSNRFGFSLDSSLAYIHDVAPVTLYGPRVLPAGDDYENWYRGRAVDFDSAFHAPSFVAERFKRFDSATQRTVWMVRKMVRKNHSYNPPDLRRVFQYLAFLKGLRDGHIESVSRYSFKSVPDVVRDWPDDYSWPSFFYYLEAAL